MTPPHADRLMSSTKDKIFPIHQSSSCSSSSSSFTSPSSFSYFLAQKTGQQPKNGTDSDHLPSSAEDTSSSIQYLMDAVSANNSSPNEVSHGVDSVMNNTIQYNTMQDNTTQHNTTQHNTTQHNTTQHNTLHYSPHGTNTIAQRNVTQHKKSIFWMLSAPTIALPMRLVTV